MEDTRTSILQMARGAIMERIDYEMAKVVDNILDPNTEATASRVRRACYALHTPERQGSGGILPRAAKQR